MWNELYKMLAIAANNKNGWMSKDGYKGLRTATPVTKEWMLSLEDNYIGGLRNIGKGRRRDETCERVGELLIDWSKKEWVMGQVGWLGSLN